MSKQVNMADIKRMIAEGPEPADVSSLPAHMLAEMKKNYRRSGGLTIERMKCISQHGNRWIVRIGDGDKLRQRCFSSSQFGDIRSALNAAMSWRDSVERYTGKPASGRRVVMQPRSKKTQAPIGVYRVRGAHWVARGTKVGGGLWSKGFLISRHGEEGAKAKAIAARERFERENY